MSAEEETISYVEPHGTTGVPELPPGEPVIDAEEVVGEPAVIQDGWEEAAVREHLLMGGDMLHAFIGVAETDWRMSERDLERIAPPLARILNRHPEMAKLAVFSDPVLVGWGTGLYAYRSVLQARAARMDAAEAQAREDASERAQEGAWEHVPRQPEQPDMEMPVSRRSARAEAMLAAAQQHKEDL